MSTTDPNASAAELGTVAAIEMMNARHAVVREGGKTIVITEEHDPVLDRIVLARSSFSDLRNFYRNRLVNVGSDEKPDRKMLGEYWLSHPARRQFEGVTFQPGKATPGYFNLWKGFAVVPVRGEWSLMRSHIQEVICGGNATVFQWLLGWMAAAVQFPDCPAEISIVLRGKQATGKGVFARSFGSIFGQHFVHVSNLRHLVGNFNAHLHDALVLFADEVSWIGDRQAEGVLKMLVTEPFIPIERKGRDVITAKNHLHILIASNHEWVVPAEFDDRRFLVIDVSDEHVRDIEYFRAIVDQMKAGGLAAMLHDLQQLDLSGIDLRQAPATEALREQKRFSMTPQQRWWFEKLNSGELLPGHENWPLEVLRENLHRDFVETMRSLAAKDGATPTELGIHLRKLLPSGYPRKSQRMVELFPGHGKEKKWHWGLPCLSECRAHFDRLTRTEHEWPSDGELEPS